MIISYVDITYYKVRTYLSLYILKWQNRKTTTKPKGITLHDCRWILSDKEKHVDIHAFLFGTLYN